MFVINREEKELKSTIFRMIGEKKGRNKDILGKSMYRGEENGL